MKLSSNLPSHVRRRAAAEHEIQERIAVLRQYSAFPEMTSLEKEQHAREMVEVTKALYQINRFSYAQYVRYAVFWPLTVHADRMINGFYAEEMDPISAEIRRVEREHGLKPGEFWYRGQGPPEWNELNRHFEAVLDRRRPDVLREFGLPDLADLLEENPRRFHALTEPGDGEPLNLPDGEARLEELFRRYRTESLAAEASEAFYAAAATRGAALEALLLLRCVREPAKVTAALGVLPSRERPRGDPFSWTLGQLILVVHAAGWLPSVDVDGATLDIQRQANSLRHLRNLLHPGRHLRESLAFELNQEHLLDARAALVVIETVLEELEMHGGQEDIARDATLRGRVSQKPSCPGEVPEAVNPQPK